MAAFGSLIPLRPQVVGDTLTHWAAVVKSSLTYTSGVSARQPVTTAGVWVELLSLPHARLMTLSALTQAGIRVQGLVPGTLRGAHTATQLIIPPLAGRARLPLALTFALAFTGIVVQFPAWITAGFSEAVLTDALARGLIQNSIGPTESQQA